MPVGDLTWGGGILLGLGMSSDSRIYFTGGFLSHTHRKLGACTKTTGQTVLTPESHFLSACEQTSNDASSLRACVPLGGAGEVGSDHSDSSAFLGSGGVPGKEKGGSVINRNRLQIWGTSRQVLSPCSCPEDVSYPR